MARPAIPEHIKREVRRKCGFGCIFCGNMIYEYEHIIPYSVDKVHDYDNLVLLCRNHHGEVTSGRKSKSMVRQAASNPYAKRTTSRGATYNFDSFLSPVEVELGGNIYIFRPGEPGANVAVIEDVPVFSIYLDEGFPQFSFIMHDTEGNRLISVDRNEVTARSGLWDVELTGRYLRVRHGRGQIALKIKLENSRILFEKLVLINGSSSIIILNNKTIVPSGGSPINNFYGNILEGFGNNIINVFSVSCKNEDRCFIKCGDIDRKSPISKEEFESYLKLKSVFSNLSPKPGYGPFGYLPQSPDR